MSREEQDYSEQEYLEMFQRALGQNDVPAWDFLQHRFNGMMCGRLRRHPKREIAYCYESEENYRPHHIFLGKTYAKAGEDDFRRSIPSSICKRGVSSTLQMNSCSSWLPYETACKGISLLSVGFARLNIVSPHRSLHPAFANIRSVFTFLHASATASRQIRCMR